MIDLETPKIDQKQKGNLIKGQFKYEQDSERFHRFKIETDTGLVGTIYIPKDMTPLPEKLVLDRKRN